MFHALDNCLAKIGDLFTRNPTCPEHSGYRRRWEVSLNYGQGFVEILKLHSGLSVGICDYCLKDARSSEMLARAGDSLRFSFLLTGTFERGYPGGKRSQTLGPGDIWLVHGRKKAIATQAEGTTFKSISIEMPSGMVQAWLEGASCDKKFLGKIMRGMPNTGRCEATGIQTLARSVSKSHPVVQMANNLCSFQCNTMYEQLRFEALTIDILAEFLNIDTSRYHCRRGDSPFRKKAVGDALDILDDEWESPPTIAELARRVGVNECYLKGDFKDEIGLSIGAYVRKIRMERARMLIESGKYTILQVSLFVGYSNPSHFSNAFKRYYGRLPSFYASEVRTSGCEPFFIRSGRRISGSSKACVPLVSTGKKPGIMPYANNSKSS